MFPTIIVLMKFIILVILFFSTQYTYAQLPLYEIGMAAGAGYISDYPAADQGRTRAIAFPSFKYRGKLFRSDKKGTRARFFKNETIDVDLSFGASFPANSEDNKAREGMEDLDWLGEIGPRINATLLETKKHSIELEIPFRYVFSTDFDFTKHRGYRFVPQIDYKYRFLEKYTLNLSFKYGYANEKLNDYFYEVDGRDITTERPRYNAKEGHISLDQSAFLIYESEKIFYLFGLRFSNYANSNNTNSPLHRVNQDTAIFFAFNYFFYQSKEKEE